MAERDIIEIMRELLDNIRIDTTPSSFDEALVALETYRDKALEALSESGFSHTTSYSPLSARQSEEFRTLMRDFNRKIRESEVPRVMSSCRGSLIRGPVAITVGMAGGPIGVVCGFAIAITNTVTSC